MFDTVAATTSANKNNDDGDENINEEDTFCSIAPTNPLRDDRHSALANFTLTTPNDNSPKTTRVVAQPSSAESLNLADLSTRTHTIIHGHRVNCFEIGGEKYLCLPELIFLVFKDVPFNEIQETYVRLNVFTRYCTLKQLDDLKQCGSIPHTSASCGLISQSDAERLCQILLFKRGLSTAFKSLPKSKKLKPSFAVSHNCFGKVRGLVFVDLYDNPNSHCIKCQACDELFSPPAFVCHKHGTEEAPTLCHWGLDSNKWRLYLLLDQRKLTNANEQKREFERFKQKFVNHEGNRLDLSGPPSYTAATPTKNEENERSPFFLSTSTKHHFQAFIPPLKRSFEDNQEAIDMTPMFLAMDVRYAEMAHIMSKTNLPENDRTQLTNKLIQLYALSHQCIRNLVQENNELVKCVDHLQSESKKRCNSSEKGPRIRLESQQTENRSNSGVDEIDVKHECDS